jgi:pimeloyl-ACP methyl ester carboxylesterase
MVGDMMFFTSSGPDDAPPVLLLHGGGVAGWMWDSLRGRLEPDYTVLVPDLPGHGRSANESYVSHSETVAALSHLLAATVPGRPVTVIGFSLGAQLAIQLASEHPGIIRQTVIISAQAKAIPFTGFTLGALGASAPLARKRWFAKLQARELFIPPRLMEDYISTSAGITKATLLAAVGDNVRFQLPAGWSTFPGRALVMVGQRERGLMRDSAAAIHAALPGSELAVIDGCGHGIPLQRPEWFNDCMTHFLHAV